MCPRFLSRLYLSLHHRTFQRRLSRAKAFPGKRIVSIGNLSMGGTGKTPLAAYLAGEALRRGRSPIVLLRGYKGRGEGLVSDGEKRLLSFREAGDEAILLSSVPGLRVACGPDRGHMLERFGGPSDFVILDDAFQNPLVRRDIDLVLMDASVSPDRMRVFPCGKFREDFDALSRATAVMLTRVNHEHAPWYRAQIRQRFPHLPVFECIHEFAGIRHMRSAGPYPDAFGAFCGIGNPGAFFRMLEGAGEQVAKTREFGDHYEYSPRDLRRLLSEAPAWITTEKDAVRLFDFPEELLRTIWIATMRLRITVGEAELLDGVFGSAKE